GESGQEAGNDARPTIGKGRPTMRHVKHLRVVVLVLAALIMLVQGAITPTVEAGDTKTVNVDCSRGQTIQQALDQSARPGRALTINIRGTCMESVVVTADDTTLTGDPTATVTSTDPLQNTILVNGAVR